MWQENDNSISKEYTFADFTSALSFVNRVGELAEQANHHPTITLEWRKVTITLSTHSQGKVTDKDRALAKEIDQL